MKWILLFLVFAMPASSAAWDVSPDSTNIATFVMYRSSGIPFPEKWTFATYEPCAGCDVDSIPFKREYRTFGDFQGVRFIHSGNQDTVFDGSIVWMGTGEIECPDSFIDGSIYDVDSMMAPPPLSVQYYEGYGGYSVADADRIISIVRKITFIKQFSGYRVGIFLYTPTIGPVDLSVARWVVFVYQGQEQSPVFNNREQRRSVVPGIAGPAYSITGNILSSDQVRKGYFLQYGPDGVLRKRMVLE